MGIACACQDGLLTSFEQPSAHSGLPCRSVHSLIITFCMIEVVKLVQIEQGGMRGMRSVRRRATHTHTHALAYRSVVAHKANSVVCSVVCRYVVTYQFTDNIW